jgi:beta-phosphoglucomutase-like phosphatase (HAD superfamily)
VLVDGVVAERDALASKPAPDMFAAGARLLGVEPARAAAVEDALSGVRSAAAAGYGLVIGVDRGVGRAALEEAGAHVVVADLAEVVEAAPDGL